MARKMDRYPVTEEELEAGGGEEQERQLMQECFLEHVVGGKGGQGGWSRGQSFPKPSGYITG